MKLRNDSRYEVSIDTFMNSLIIIFICAFINSLIPSQLVITLTKNEL